MPRREKDAWANQLVQIVGAVRLLSRLGGASNDELIEDLEIGERTLFRLKNTLEKMGIPINTVENTSADRKRWQIPSEVTLTFPKTSNLGLTTPELLSLYAVRVSSGLFMGSAIQQDLDSAFEKIGQTLSPATKGLLERYARLFISVPNVAKDYSSSAEIIEEISLAIIECNVCTISYYSFSDDRIKKYDINPLHFFEREGGLYLLVVVSDYGDVRTLAVERIKSVETTDKTFEYPGNFNVEEHLSSAFSLYFEEPVEVVIRFKASQEKYIRERQWARGQKIDNEADGSVVLTISTCGWWDIKRWIMSFGDDAEIVSPQKMRTELAADLAASLAKYRL